jgi:hypothetical protein
MTAPQHDPMTTETLPTDEIRQSSASEEPAPVPLEPHWEDLCDWATD